MLWAGGQSAPVGSLHTPAQTEPDGEFYGDPRKRFFAELIIDIEEDPFTRVVSVGMLRERER